MLCILLIKTCTLFVRRSRHSSLTSGLFPNRPPRYCVSLLLWRWSVDCWCGFNGINLLCMWLQWRKLRLLVSVFFVCFLFLLFFFLFFLFFSSFFSVLATPARMIAKVFSNKHVYEMISEMVTPHNEQCRTQVHVLNVPSRMWRGLVKIGRAISCHCAFLSRPNPRLSQRQTTWLF